MGRRRCGSRPPARPAVSWRTLRSPYGHVGTVCRIRVCAAGVGPSRVQRPLASRCETADLGLCRFPVGRARVIGLREAPRTPLQETSRSDPRGGATRGAFREPRERDVPEQVPVRIVRSDRPAARRGRRGRDHRDVRAGDPGNPGPAHWRVPCAQEGLRRGQGMHSERTSSRRDRHDGVRARVPCSG